MKIHHLCLFKCLVAFCVSIYLVGCRGSSSNAEEKPPAAEAQGAEGPSQVGIMGVRVGPHLYRANRVLRQALEAPGRFGVAVVLEPTQGAPKNPRSSQLVFQLTLGLQDKGSTAFLQWAVPGEILHLANAHYASMGQRCGTQIHYGLDGSIHGQVACPQLDCTTGNGWFFKTMCPFGNGVPLTAHFTGLK